MKCDGVGFYSGSLSVSPFLSGRMYGGSGGMLSQSGVVEGFCVLQGDGSSVVDPGIFGTVARRFASRSGFSMGPVVSAPFEVVGVCPGFFGGRSGPSPSRQKSSLFRQIIDLRYTLPRLGSSPRGRSPLVTGVSVRSLRQSSNPEVFSVEELV